MKIRIDVECTPEEARRALGMPDVSDLNRTLVDHLQQRLEQTMSEMDTETLLRAWLPAGAESWRKMQEAFWSNLAGAASGGREPGGGTGKDE